MNSAALLLLSAVISGILCWLISTFVLPGLPLGSLVILWVIVSLLVWTGSLPKVDAAQSIDARSRRHG